jgi:ribosome recycling factor
MDLEETKLAMDMALEHFESELTKVRTGRASASILDGVMAVVYGTPTPLNHIANVVALDAQTLQIQPYDPNNLDAISAAIREDQSLGLNPSDDGKVIRIGVPPLTTERRQEIVKQIKEKVEEARISLRNTRHDALNAAKEQEKNGDITKDDLHDAEKKLNDLVDQYNHKLEEAFKAKEKEVLTV